ARERLPRARPAFRFWALSPGLSFQRRRVDGDTNCSGRRRQPGRLSPTISDRATGRCSSSAERPGGPTARLAEKLTLGGSPLVRYCPRNRWRVWAEFRKARRCHPGQLVAFACCIGAAAELEAGEPAAPAASRAPFSRLWAIHIRSPSPPP